MTARTLGGVMSRTRPSDRECGLKTYRLSGMLILGLALVGCDDGGSSGPSAACEFSGITSTDASGLQLGPSDPDDWCADVAPARPNPASAATLLQYRIAVEQRVQVWVRGAESGRLRTLVDAVQPAGTYAVDWDMTTDSGAPVEPGIYCVSIVTDEYSCTGDVDVRDGSAAADARTTRPTGPRVRAH